MVGLFSMVLEPMMIGMLFFIGVFAGIKTRWVQFRCFGKMLGILHHQKKEKDGEISSFAAAMTALSGTIGTGNIIGVAIALQTGGPGALFWMCAAAFLSMAVKYLEIALACTYRKQYGKMTCGGPMYYIERLLHSKYYGRCFAIACLITGCGVGNLAQTVSAANAVSLLAASDRGKRSLLFLAASLFALCLYLGMRGGGKMIGKITAVLTPCMAIGYLTGCIILLICFADRIPNVVRSIFIDAFDFRSVGGAVFGITLRTGFTRGLFTNESGLGSAPIVHAASKEDAHTAGLWGIFEVFFDTVVMCSITGVTLLASGVISSDGMHMEADAFTLVFGKGGYLFLAAALWLFALAGAFGWGFYGSRSLFYLMGHKAKGQNVYTFFYAFLAFCGFYASPKAAFFFADLANCAMLLLHTIALFCILTAHSLELRDNRIIFQKIIEKKRK